MMSRKKNNLQMIFLVALALLFLTTVAFSARADDCVSPITDGYGEAGPYAVGEYTFANPVNWNMRVHVYYPKGQYGPKPVLFFCPGYFAVIPASYQDYIDNIVSQGDVVLIFSPYNALGYYYNTKYNEMKIGFQKAVDRYRYTLNMDLSRIGILGHSFGAGAIPAMYKAALNQGWGSNAAFLHPLAPFFVYDMTDADFARFPADTKVLIEVYEKDDTNGHNIAIAEIWNKLTSIPAANKDWIALMEASDGGSCSLTPDHLTPGNQTLDALDWWGVWRHTRALIDYTFYDDQNAGDIAMGHGNDAQTFMGTWLSDGTEVERIHQMDDPAREPEQPATEWYWNSEIDNNKPYDRWR